MKLLKEWLEYIWWWIVSLWVVFRRRKKRRSRKPDMGVASPLVTPEFTRLLDDRLRATEVQRRAARQQLRAEVGFTTKYYRCSRCRDTGIWIRKVGDTPNLTDPCPDCGKDPMEGMGGDGI